MKYQTPERKIKTITITLTQSCNLKCSYCYENNKSPKVMTFSTAQQIIDNELQNKDKYTGFEIDLFGGEPFLQFELIKQITNYGSNYASTGNIYHRDINMCRLTKIMVKACSYFYAMQWQNGQLNVEGNELQSMLKSIEVIQKELVIS